MRIPTPLGIFLWVWPCGEDCFWRSVRSRNIRPSSPRIFRLPPDYQQKTEWTRARLRYPDVLGYPDPALRYADGREFPGYWKPSGSSAIALR